MGRSTGNPDEVGRAAAEAYVADLGQPELRQRHIAPLLRFNQKANARSAFRATAAFVIRTFELEPDHASLVEILDSDL